MAKPASIFLSALDLSPRVFVPNNTVRTRIMPSAVEKSDGHNEALHTFLTPSVIQGRWETFLTEGCVIIFPKLTNCKASLGHLKHVDERLDSVKTVLEAVQGNKNANNWCNNILQYN